MTSHASSLRSPRPPRPSSRKPPSVRRFARHGCRSSKTCRCRPRTKSARPAAKPRRSIRRRPGCRCCSASPMSASAAATKRPSRRSPPAPPVRPCRRCRNASPSAPWRSKSRRMSRYPNMPGGPRRRDWTFTVARHLLPRRHRATIIWISRPSCAASRTEICYNSDDEKGPGLISRDLCFWPGERCRHFCQAADIKSLIMYFVVGWQRRNYPVPCRNLVKLWREYGRDRVTIGKKA